MPKGRLHAFLVVFAGGCLHLLASVIWAYLLFVVFWGAKGSSGSGGAESLDYFGAVLWALVQVAIVFGVTVIASSLARGRRSISLTVLAEGLVITAVVGLWTVMFGPFSLTYSLVDGTNSAGASSASTAVQGKTESAVSTVPTLPAPIAEAVLRAFSAFYAFDNQTMLFPNDLGVLATVGSPIRITFQQQSVGAPAAIFFYSCQSQAENSILPDGMKISSIFSLHGAYVLLGYDGGIVAGETIDTLDKNFELEITLDDPSILEQAALYFWNDPAGRWEGLPAKVRGNTISARSNMLTDFAASGIIIPRPVIKGSVTESKSGPATSPAKHPSSSGSNLDWFSPIFLLGFGWIMVGIVGLIQTFKIIAREGRGQNLTVSVWRPFDTIGQLEGHRQLLYMWLLLVYPFWFAIGLAIILVPDVRDVIEGVTGL